MSLRDYNSISFEDNLVEVQKLGYSRFYLVVLDPFSLIFELLDFRYLALVRLLLQTYFLYP